MNYPADLSLTSAAQGNADLVNHVKSQAAACPNQRFVLVGYSQGANVVDNSIGISSAGAVVGSPIVATIPAALEPKVAAVLLFGNPIRAIGKSVTGTYQSRTIDFCAKGDPVCESGGRRRGGAPRLPRERRRGGHLRRGQGLIPVRARRRARECILPGPSPVRALSWSVEAAKPIFFRRPWTVQIETVRASICQDRQRSSKGWAA